MCVAAQNLLNYAIHSTFIYEENASHMRQICNYYTPFGSRRVACQSRNHVQNACDVILYVDIMVGGSREVFDRHGCS